MLRLGGSKGPEREIDQELVSKTTLNSGIISTYIVAALGTLTTAMTASTLTARSIIQLVTVISSLIWMLYWLADNWWMQLRLYQMRNPEKGPIPSPPTWLIVQTLAAALISFGPILVFLIVYNVEVPPM